MSIVCPHSFNHTNVTWKWAYLSTTIISVEANVISSPLSCSDSDASELNFATHKFLFNLWWVYAFCCDGTKIMMSTDVNRQARSNSREMRWRAITTWFSSLQHSSWRRITAAPFPCRRDHRIKVSFHLHIGLHRNPVESPHSWCNFHATFKKLPSAALISPCIRTQ